MSSKKGLTTDQRFSRVMKDPRFWEMPEKEKKIKIDKRFRSMFTDKKFSLNYTVDKRGRPMQHNTTEDLKRFYDLSDSSDGASSEEEEEEAGTKKGKQKAKLKQKSGAETNKISTKAQKEKKKTLTSKESTSNVDSKKTKDKGNTNMEKHEILENKQKTTKSIAPAKKPVQKVEEEKSEESELEEESDDSKNEICSGEDDSEMDLKDDEDEESDDEDDDDDEEEDEEEDESQDEGSEEDEASSGEEGDSDSGPDLARGKGNIETSSEDEDDDDEVTLDLANKDTEIEHDWREMDKDAPRGDQVTTRLAVCNMDWDRLKAKDLLALFSSFKPKGGIVFSVKIYPSEFGKEKLKEEELHGPTELKNVSEDVADDQGVYKEKLREYQFRRLKYFYAVVECDSPETANKIYEDCDGLEFESSCSFVDLRFIPDDVQFDDEPKDTAVDVDISAYKPKFFTSAANVTSKVELTWDETDQERITALNRPFKKNEILDMDFKAYLASSSEEDEEEPVAESEVVESKKGPKDDEEQIARYRELLKNIQEKEKKHEDKDVEMEVKWVPGLKESAEQMVKNKLEGNDQLTPWEKYLKKQKEKKKLKKRKKESVEEEEEDDNEEEDEIPSDVDFNDPYFSEELKKSAVKKSTAGKNEEELSEDEKEKEKQQAEMALLMMDDVEDDRKHFNYDKIVEQQNLSRSKKKKLKKKEDLVEDNFQIDVDDSRFQAMYTSHLYNLDPSDPNFKKTKAMERVLQEKGRRREQEQTAYTETVKKQRTELENLKKTGTSSVKSKDPSLSLLLKSVKSKTQQFQASKKQKTK